MRKLLFFIFILGLVTVGCSSDSAESDVTGVTWKWVQLKETAPTAQSIVSDPDNYTIVFNEDGSFSTKADCNSVGGSYTIEGDSLTFELGPTTLAECGEDSLYDQYLMNLGRVGSYSVEDERLTLNFQDDAGNMVFTQ